MYAGMRYGFMMVGNIASDNWLSIYNKHKNSSQQLVYVRMYVYVCMYMYGCIYVYGSHTSNV